MTDVTGTTPNKYFKQRHKFGKHGLSIKKKIHLLTIVSFMWVRQQRTTRQSLSRDIKRASNILDLSIDFREIHTKIPVIVNEQIQSNNRNSH